jgi:hypothetical protein
MAMEVIEFNNLQDNIVYHANIFNYDKQFLMNLLKTKIRLDFSEYYQLKNTQGKDRTSVSDYFQKSSKEQVELMAYTAYKEFEIHQDDLEPEPENEKNKRDKQIVKKALRYLFNLFMYSYEKAEERAKSIEGEQIMAGELHSDNLIACLLYLDGISMINVDVILLIKNNAQYTGKSLDELVFMLLNNNLVDFHIKEIASHILSIYLMQIDGNKNEEKNEMDINKITKDLMKWTYEQCIQKQRDSCLTSNLALLLTIDENIEYFLGEFNEQFPCIRRLFELMTESDININIIYESLLCMWNISSYKKYFYFFENKEHKYIEKIVQVIRTNKIDKVARIGLMTLQNLLESQTCVEILFDIKFMQTVSILLTNKWNDPIIKELLNYCLDFLEKNYKSMK